MSFAANEVALAQYKEAKDVIAQFGGIRGQLDGELWGKINAIVDDAELYKKSGERERLQGLCGRL